jgi:LruC domain-containing protein
MVSFSSIFRKACLGFSLAVLLAACVDKSKYEGPGSTEEEPSVKVPNSFDFSTVQKVNLSVDYSAIKTYGPVFFGIYTENPFIIQEDAPDDLWNENVSPIYEDYTEDNGKFNAVVELPAYAKHLYIATGNFFTGMMLLEADVKDGAASVVAEGHKVYAARAATRAEGPGESTNNMSKLNLTNTIGGVKERVYNDWKNWLGTWNSASGRPDYLLDKATADSKLVISEEEMEGLYAAVGSAFVSGSTMNDEYSSYPDLLLTQDSEVTFTLLGGSTCWNSTLGYYYYTDDKKPTNPMDINIIMLFPNTQDGQWARATEKKLKSYNGNIGVNRGDVVQLMYYPNIANNDKTGATKVFPKGTRIGFILKTQGWAAQGNPYSILCDNNGKDKYWNTTYNIWSSTTEGLSVGRPRNSESYKCPIQNGESRGAKFSYKTKNGDNYTIISFEDAMDDTDFDDLIFALKPVGVFAPLPEIANRKSSTTGVYAFEDKWPSKGDYDLNDAVVNAKHEREFDSNGKIIKETFYLTTYQNYVELTSGLALTLNTQVNPKSIAMKKIAPGSTVAEEASFVKDRAVYYLTDDIKAEIGTTYILELTYNTALDSSSKMASIQPFIYRSEGTQNWEVHIPMEAPTPQMNTSYFGKDDDCSDQIHGLFFVRQGNYPFAFYLKNADINAFKETILKRENESIPIDQFFPGFLDWSISGGTYSADWYLKPE